MRVLRESSVHLRRTLPLALALGAVLLFWPGADAQDARVSRHKSAAAEASGRHRKASAVRELCKLRTSSARQAIKDLADDSDDLTAIVAMQALCREDFSGARDKLESVFEDDDRTDIARSMAVLSLLHRREKDGDSWSDVERYVRSHTSANGAVRQAALAGAKKLWRSEVGDE